MIKNLVLLSLMLFSSLCAFSQERANYQLLWEISKEDISSPSYLFGTMHIKDERAFQFPDALIPAIESVNVFALEIDPDQVILKLMGKMTDTNYENVYKKILSTTEYQKLKSRFYEVNEIDLDSFPMQHPMMIESMLSKEKKRPNDRRTFVDAFLYSIAYQYNKEITGLENFEDQFPDMDNISEESLRSDIMYLIENSQKEQDDFLENLVEVYYSGDLDKILEYINSYDKNDSILVSRNKKMVQSMDSIMGTKTLFSAVGAAHLPGKNGIVKLLQKEGYTVTLVPPTFIKDNSRFTLIPNIEKWTDYEDRVLGYSLKVPTEGTVTMLPNDQTMNTAIDLISGYEFAYLGFDTSKRKYAEGYDIIEEIVKGQIASENITLKSRKDFTKESFKVTELLVQKEEKTNRMQLYFDGRYAYLFSAEGSAEDISSAYVDAFFDSVSVFTPEKPVAEWINHTDEIGAYSIDITGAISDISQKTPSPDDENAIYELNIFKTHDTEKNIINLLRYNDQPIGYYLQDENIIKEQYNEYFNDKGTVLNDPIEFSIDGNKAISYEVLLADKYHTRGIVISRGNRSYLILSQAINPEDKVAEDYHFLNSFKLLPYKEAVFLDTYTKDNFTVDFPGKFQDQLIEEYDLNSEFETLINKSSLDPTSGGAYILQQTVLKPYFKTTSKADYYNTYADFLLEYGDTLINSSNVIIDGIPAKNLTIYNEITSVRQRITILMQDDTMYTLLCYLGDEEINRAQSYFDSFKIHRKKEKFDITVSKTKQLLKNLRSKDSVIFNKAEAAFDYYVFDKEDNKLLLENLKYTFADNNEYYGAKYHILDELATLDQPSSSQKIISYYNKEKDNDLKIQALKSVGAFTDAKSKQIFLKILKENPPSRDSETSFDVFDNIINPAQFIIDNEAATIELMERELYRDKLVQLYANNIMYDSIYKNSLTSFKEAMKKYFIDDSEIYMDTIQRKNHPFINYGLINSYTQIINNDSLSDDNTQKALLIIASGLEDDNWLQTTALVNAIKLNIEIPEEITTNRLKEYYSRFEVMEALVNNNQKDKIPSKYLASKEFSKLSIYNAAGYDYDEYPDIINYLGDVTYNDEVYHVYNYGNSNGDLDSELYLAYAIAKDADVTNFVSNTAEATYYLLEEDWKLQTTTYLKSLENNEE